MAVFPICHERYKEYDRLYCHDPARIRFCCILNTSVLPKCSQSNSSLYYLIILATGNSALTSVAAQGWPSPWAVSTQGLGLVQPGPKPHALFLKPKSPTKLCHISIHGLNIHHINLRQLQPFTDFPWKSTPSGDFNKDSQSALLLHFTTGRTITTHAWYGEITGNIFLQYLRLSNGKSPSLNCLISKQKCHKPHFNDEIQRKG